MKIVDVIFSCSWLCRQNHTKYKKYPYSRKNTLKNENYKPCSLMLLLHETLSQIGVKIHPEIPYICFPDISENFEVFTSRQLIYINRRISSPLHYNVVPI